MNESQLTYLYLTSKGDEYSLPVKYSPSDFTGILLHKIGISGLLVDEVVDLSINTGQSDSTRGVDLHTREVAQVKLQRHDG